MPSIRIVCDNSCELIEEIDVTGMDLTRPLVRAALIDEIAGWLQTAEAHEAEYEAEVAAEEAGR